MPTRPSVLLLGVLSSHARDLTLGSDRAVGCILQMGFS
jgi:hypothetical protein